MMNTVRTLNVACLVLIISLGNNSHVCAQGAPIGGSSLVLQDSSGKTITMQPPSGMSAGYTYQLPLAPGGTVPAGFVDAGNDTGQSVMWDGVAWVPSNYVAQKYGNVGLGFSTIPSTMPFPITLAQTIGPNNTGLIDLGDVAHHFGTLYVDNIVGASGFLNLWSRNVLSHTLTPLTPGDNLSTSGSIFTTGGGSITSAGPLSAIAGMSLTGTFTANGSSGSLGQVLTIDVSGDPKWAAPAITSSLPFADLTSSTNTSAVMAVGVGASLITSGGAIEATKFKGVGSTTDAVDLATAEVNGILPIINGGTGANTASAGLANLLPNQLGNTGKVLMTDGTAATWQSLPSTGTVTSIDVSGGSTGLTASGGPITSSGTITFGGILSISNGGTGATTASGAFANLLPMQTGNTGKVLMTDGTAATWQSLPSTGTVTSIDLSGGSTGLTASGGPITSSGTITLGGTLAIANGGTGANSQSGALNNILPDQSGNSGKFLQTNGSNASWISLPGSGTVTSVSLSTPPEFSVSGAPITASGRITISKANENANTIYAGPASGVAGPPSFRALVANDIPNNAANTSGTASGFTGSLVGDVTGTQANTVVSSVGGSSAANVHAAEVTVAAATNANTPSTLVQRDASGNFSAGTITASLNGNASTATTAGSTTNFSGTLSGDVTGTQTSTVVSSVGGSSAASVHAAEVAVAAATNANTPSTLVQRDASGNFSAGTITASLNGNASTATTAGSTTNFSGTLSGDVTGTQTSTVVSSVGGSSAANVHAAEVTVAAATNANTPSTLVQRDASGNFSSGNLNLGQVTLRGTGAGTSSIAAGAQGTTTINYTLPTSQPSTNQVLTATAVSGSGPYAVTLGWTTPSGGSSSVLFAMKSTYQDYTSTTATNDADLYLSLAANATYVFEGFLTFTDQSANNTDGKITFTVPTGSTLRFGLNSASASSGVTQGSTSFSGSGTLSNQMDIINGNSSIQTFVYVKGIAITSSTSGNLQFKCARFGGSTLRLQANSYITATRVQ